MIRNLGRWVAHHWPISFPREIGLFEVLLYPVTGDLQSIRRHAVVIGWLEEVRLRLGVDHVVALDFGGGNGALWETLRRYRLAEHYELIVADVDPEMLADIPSNHPSRRLQLREDGDIPLPDGGVDLVVSSDALEHIPPARRDHWLGEIKRVARHGYALTFPADSIDRRWASTVTDAAFDQWHREIHGAPDRWIAEHLANPQPVIEDVAARLPEATIRGFANVDEWGRMMRDAHSPASLAGRLRYGFGYLLVGRRRDRRSPWKSALFTWDDTRPNDAA